MAPKPPPKPPPPPPPKNVFERFGNFLDSDQGKKRTTMLVLLFFILAVVMTILYQIELKKNQQHLEAVASVRQFALTYDPSLHGKSDMEILAAVHLLTLHLLNWTLKNEELQNELKILTELLPGWQAFEKNLYYFSDVRKTWHAAREDCLARHTADLVIGKYGEEQGFINEMVTKNKHDYWLGLYKKDNITDDLIWINGDIPKENFWYPGQPDGHQRETCVVAIPPCTNKFCWHDAPCNEARYFCCKLEPKRRWMY
ncbi:C-type lectin domain family 4 member K-like [Pantherophis guttatus]|uniref:C-type lectin domain family 4 member K-like n=1 Tax=Pantherophis guttatus TaxID=94885 RepID=A0ABM3ZII3_PANGU|nr:C-type lectin domain family 4 member K-like [Pantherophis guttatus]